MVLLAFSLQDQIDKYGTYIGIAAFFGLAILTLLYFAQAREVKRLREWAGRAPERAVELEQAVQEHAQEVRRAPATPAPAPQPVPVQQLSPTVATSNGTVELKPAEVAALAFARSAGVHEPHEPTAHPVPVAAAAPPTEVAVAGAAIATGEPAAAQALNGGNGSGSRTGVPKPATPAARRSDAPPLPPLPPRRAAAAANRRPSAAAPAPRRDSNTRAVVLTAVIGVLVLAGAVFGITRVMGGDDQPTQTPPNNVPTAVADDDEEPTATATPAPQVTKENALVGVYNGTGQTGLARGQEELLIGEGYPDDNVGTGDAPDLRQASVVFYARGARSAAQGVADVLGISEIKQLTDDAAVQALVDKSPQKWNVVAIVGADKSS